MGQRNPRGLFVHYNQKHHNSNYWCNFIIFRSKNQRRLLKIRRTYGFRKWFGVHFKYVTCKKICKFETNTQTKSEKTLEAYHAFLFKQHRSFGVCKCRHDNAWLDFWRFLHRTLRSKCEGILCCKANARRYLYGYNSKIIKSCDIG